jgi:hypothetical protein
MKKIFLTLFVLLTAVSNYVFGLTGYWAANSSMPVNNVYNPVLRSAIVSPLASGAGHVAGGTTVNLFAGQSLGNSFVNSFDGIGKNMTIGGSIGVATTIGVSYANGINPWTGKAVAIQENMNVRIVTPEGVVLPEGAIIPDHFIENPKLPGRSYGVYNANGQFQEILRIDPGTPPGMKVPNNSHFHLNKSKTHIFDINKWPWWAK